VASVRDAAASELDSLEEQAETTSFLLRHETLNPSAVAPNFEEAMRDTRGGGRDWREHRLPGRAEKGGSAAAEEQPNAAAAAVAIAAYRIRLPSARRRKEERA